MNYAIRRAAGITDSHYDRAGAPDDDGPPNRRTYQRDVPTGTNTLEGSPAETTDLFVKHDAWGRLAYHGTATLRSAGGGQHTYGPNDTDRPKEIQRFAYDALGRRRLTETRVLTRPSSTTFRGARHSYYDAAGNALQEDAQASATDPVTTVDVQCVWAGAGPGWLVTQDERGCTGACGRPGSGLDLRRWVMQGSDGSTTRVVDDTDISKQMATRFRYTPEGQVLTLTPASRPYTYLDETLGQVDRRDTWHEVNNAVYTRYLWRGFRAETYVDDEIEKLSGVYWTDTHAHDGWRGEPLHEDAAAYASGASSYSQWTGVATSYPHNGTGGLWASPGSVFWSDFGARGAGLVQAGFGLAQAGLGIAAGKTGVGALVGVPMVLHGLDDVWAGSRTAWGDGADHETYTAHYFGGGADLALGLLGPGAAFKATRWGAASFRWAAAHPRQIAQAGFVGAGLVGTGMYDPTGFYDADDAEASKLRAIQAAAGAILGKATPAFRAMNLSMSSAAKGRSYVTYAFKNAMGEVVYIGKTGGRGLPEVVMRRRLSRGHERFKKGLTPEVYSVHRSSAAARGAEHFFWHSLRARGTKLTNVNAPIGFDRLDRAEKGLHYLRRFINE